MMMKLLPILFLATPCLALDKEGAYVGGGLGVDALSLSTPGNAASSFTSQGYVFESGYQFSFGAMISAEFGESNSINKLVSETYMETGKLSYYTAKLGYNFGQIAAGFGYRHNTLVLKSLSLDNSSYLQSNSKGSTAIGYLNLNFDVNKFVRSTVEAQYLSGTLKSESAGLPDVKINNLSLSLRLFIFFE